MAAAPAIRWRQGTRSSLRCRQQIARESGACQQFQVESMSLRHSSNRDSACPEVKALERETAVLSVPENDRHAMRQLAAVHRAIVGQVDLAGILVLRQTDLEAQQLLVGFGEEPLGQIGP